MSVTIPESPVTLVRNTHHGNVQRDRGHGPVFGQADFDAFGNAHFSSFIATDYALAAMNFQTQVLELVR